MWIEASVLPELLAQIPQDTPVEVVGGDGAYDTKAARAVIAGRCALARQSGRGATAQRGH